MIAFSQPNLMVNLLGERFVNEDPSVSSAFARNAIACQKDGTAFTIFDEDAKQYYMDKGFDLLSGGIQVPITKATNFDEELKQTLAAGSPNTFVADSIEELASQTGIDLKGLQETLDEYNKACDTGRDEIFYKKARYLRPVRRPKFYANKSRGGGNDFYYGIKVNHKLEVMTPDFRIIPGLYAIGTDAASNIYHGTYPMIMPATAMGFAFNSGRIAGENAVKYLAANE
jgi:fumarate reductase flavoprotein subunit